jgi:hypothetical protein
MISLALSAKYDRKLTESLPAGVFAFMLLSYILAVTGHVSHIIGLFAAYEMIGLAAVFFLKIKENKHLTEPLKEPGLAIFAVMAVVIWFVSLHMKVTNFDDFHSWAIQPKDMFFADGLPTGDMASSYYRDYFPLVQIMDYMLLKIMGRYSESAMFAMLWWLMLVTLLPFLHGSKEDKRYLFICHAVTGLILPFLFSFQFLHCLGPDILVTTLFGCALVYIFEIKAGQTDTYEYIRILLSVALLAVLKTTSLIFAMVCIAVFVIKTLDIRKRTAVLECLLLPVVTASFWLSWNSFCRARGNTTYLSDNLRSSLSADGITFPYYTASTIKAFVAKLFTYGLNDGRAGLTSFCILLFFVICFIVYRYIKGRDIRDTLSFITIILGMAGYLLVMIYIYLFVFEEWEALSLSSYDRYISTYFGAMMYLGFYMLFSVDRLLPAWLTPLLTMLMLFTVNYPYVASTLVPAGYETAYGEVIREKEKIEAEYMERSGAPAHYGEKIVIIDDGEGQLRDKVLPYAAVPGVVRLIRPDAEGKMPTEEEIREMIAERSPERVVDMR